MKGPVIGPVIGLPSRRTRIGGSDRMIRGLLTQPPQVVKNVIERASINVLHHIIVGPVFFTDSEYRDDVRVMQPRGGAGLTSKTLDLAGILEFPVWQDLERDATAKRLLLGFIDNSHAAAANLSHDAVLAKAVRGPGRPGRLECRGSRARRDRPRVFKHDQGREEVADLVGQMGMTSRIIAQRGPFTAAIAVEKLVGQPGHRVRHGVGVSL